VIHWFDSIAFRMEPGDRSVQPLRMEPIFQERPWGGRRLADLLGKDLPAGASIGESWELADHPKARTRVADGPLAGKTVRWLLENRGADVIGLHEMAHGGAARFPLMVKFIDVAGRLDLAVHPHEALAATRQEGGTGKTECWVVLDAEPDAWVVEGLKPGVTRKGLAQALQDGAADDVLALRNVSAGDFVWIPAGRLHAAGGGVVLAEVAQNSDAAYPVPVSNPSEGDDQPPDPGAAEALEAIDFSGEAPPAGGSGRTTSETGLAIEHLVDCHAFSLTRVRIDRRPWAAATGGAYAVVVALRGTCTLATSEADLALAAGTTVLVPAGADEYAFTDADAFTCLVAAPPGKAPTR